MDILLISRLLVLEYLLGFSNSSFTPERWMLLQVCPYVFGIQDIFNTLFNHIVGLMNTTDSWNLTTRFLLSKKESSLHGKPSFLTVLDEAQALRDIGFGDYLSTQGGEKRSVLSLVLHGFRRISMSPDDYCTLPCGTDKRVIDFGGWEDKESIRSFINHINRELAGDLNSWLPPTAIDSLFLRLRDQSVIEMVIKAQRVNVWNSILTWNWKA
ncbi:MAG: hypothetical protein J3Q66DRAFT_419280 [Benniella sp.]|nr:MAG: hypothetical protein J3Q66DRAFT_419280 [Benniella sp.]